MGSFNNGGQRGPSRRNDQRFGVSPNLKSHLGLGYLATVLNVKSMAR